MYKSKHNILSGICIGKCCRSRVCIVLGMTALGHGKVHRWIPLAKCQKCGVMMFSLLVVGTNCWLTKLSVISDTMIFYIIVIVWYSNYVQSEWPHKQTESHENAFRTTGPSASQRIGDAKHCFGLLSQSVHTAVNWPVKFDELIIMRRRYNEMYPGETQNIKSESISLRFIISLINLIA